MAVVSIPPLCRDLTGGVAQAEVAGKTVAEIVQNLDDLFPGMAARLTAGDEMGAGVGVSIDGAMSAAGLRASVGPNSEVHFHPAIGGG